MKHDETRAHYQFKSVTRAGVQVKQRGHILAIFDIDLIDDGVGEEAMNDGGRLDAERFQDLNVFVGEGHEFMLIVIIRQWSRG